MEALEGRQSLHEIGRAYNKPHISIRHLLLPRGGITPAARRRSRLSFTLAEREDISRGICSGSPLREIARRLNRAASTVSREVSRDGGRPAYRAHVADDRAWDSALRPKKCLPAVNHELGNVASKLIRELVFFPTKLFAECRKTRAKIQCDADLSSKNQPEKSSVTGQARCWHGHRPGTFDSVAGTLPFVGSVCYGSCPLSVAPARNSFLFA
jgi:hypothetical protein